MKVIVTGWPEAAAVGTAVGLTERAVGWAAAVVGLATLAGAAVGWDGAPLAAGAVTGACALLHAAIVGTTIRTVPSESSRCRREARADTMRSSPAAGACSNDPFSQSLFLSNPPVRIPVNSRGYRRQLMALYRLG